MKKFIKGTFELDENVTDLSAYEERKKPQLERIINFCDQFGVQILFGTADDNTYLCEYTVKANTKSLCNGLLRELKEMLREAFPRVKMLWQGSGDCWR